MICKQPDRDAPKMRCGYPLPCPWHTVVVDTAQPPTITEPVTAGVSPLARERVRQIAQAVEGLRVPRRPRRRARR